MTSASNKQIGVFLPSRRIQALQCGITTTEWDTIIQKFVDEKWILRSDETGELAIPMYVIEHFGQGGAPAFKLLEGESVKVKDRIFFKAVMKQNLDAYHDRYDIRTNETLSRFLEAILDENHKANSGMEQATDVVPTLDERAASEQTDEADPISMEEDTPKENTTVSRHNDIHSVFNVAKYAGKGKTYLDIAEEDPLYARFWIEKKDLRNIEYRELFQLALLEIENRNPATDEQIQLFCSTYPKTKLAANIHDRLREIRSGTMRLILEFLQECVKSEWRFISEIPPAEGFLNAWELLKAKKHQKDALVA